MYEVFFFFAMPIFILSPSIRMSFFLPRSPSHSTLSLLASSCTTIQGHIHYFFMNDGRKMREKEKTWWKRHKPTNKKKKKKKEISLVEERILCVRAFSLSALLIVQDRKIINERQFPWQIMSRRRWWWFSSCLSPQRNSKHACRTNLIRTTKQTTKEECNWSEKELMTWTNRLRIESN